MILLTKEQLNVLKEALESLVDHSSCIVCPGGRLDVVDLSPDHGLLSGFCIRKGPDCRRASFPTGLGPLNGNARRS